MRYSFLYKWLLGFIVLMMPMGVWAQDDLEGLETKTLIDSAKDLYQNYSVIGHLRSGEDRIIPSEYEGFDNYDIHSTYKLRVEGVDLDELQCYKVYKPSSTMFVGKVKSGSKIRILVELTSVTGKHRSKVYELSLQTIRLDYWKEIVDEKNKSDGYR